MIKFFKSNYFFFILLFLVVFLIYGKSVNFKLTNFDDYTFISQKAKILSNLKNIPQFFLKDCYFEKKTEYYRPILTISFSIEHFLFGKNLKVFHITNILLYVLALFIIYIFLSELNFNKTISKFLILLFAVHPILSSVPVWIPARNDTLLTIFFLSSLITFIYYIRTNKIKYLLLNYLFFSIALFSKETAIILFFIYPLLIYCFDLKINKKQIIYNSIFIFLLLSIYFILRHYAVRPINYSIYLEKYSYFINNIIVGIMLYIEKILHPTHIPIILYDIKPTIQTYIINIIVFISLIFILFMKKKTLRKRLIFAILFSFLTILPTFAQEEYIFFTHRLIISLLGILIITISLIEEAINKNQKSGKYFILLFTFLLLLYSFCSFLQIDKYKDSFTYWKNAYIDSPCCNNICSSLAEEYATKEMYNEAISFSLKAIEMRKSFNNYFTYANILFRTKDYVLSKDIFFKLLELDENNFSIYHCLSNIFLFELNYEKAIECAKKAVETSTIIDENISGLENLARIYSIAGKFQEAINILFELLNYDKNNPRYYFILSSLYEDLNDYDNSIIYIRKALELEPNNKKYTNQFNKLNTKLSAKN